MRDCVTGFEGIASSYIRHLTGCDTVYVEGAARGDEQKSPSRYLDVRCVEVVEVNAVKATPMPADVPAAG